MNKVVDTLKGLQRIGLVPSLTTEEEHTLVQRVAQALPESEPELVPLLLLKELNAVLVSSDIYGLGNGQAAYEEFFARLSIISHGYFTVEQVQVVQVAIDAERQQQFRVDEIAWKTSFIFQGRTYSSTQTFRSGSVDQSFDYQLWFAVDEALAEAQSPSRLVRPQIQNDELEYESYISYGLVFMSYEQCQAARKEGLLRLPFDTEFEWPERKIRDVLLDLQMLGLFPDLNEAEIERIEQSLFRRNREEELAIVYRTVLGTVPDLTFEYDSEMVYDGAEDYIELLEGISTISRGVFVPEALTGRDIIDQRNYLVAVEFSFVFRGVTYQQQLPYDSDYVDSSYLVFVNQILADVGEDGRFYYLETGDQCAMLIFLNHTQYETAKRLQLLPL